MGDKIEEFVKEHNLGVVTRSEPGGNPVHPETETKPRKIVVWVWTTDNASCSKYLSGLEKKDA